MEKQIKEWVEHHLPSKTNEDLWDLQAAILTELSRRDDVQYRVRASKESLDEKFREIGVIWTIKWSIRLKNLVKEGANTPNMRLPLVIGRKKEVEVKENSKKLTFSV